MAENGILYMRRTLSDTKVVDWSAAAAKSPDIIPYVGPASDPKDLFTRTYSEDVGKPLLVDESNSIYVRAKNMGTDAAGGSVHLYYAESAMVLLPELWQNNIIRSASGGDSVRIPSTQPGEIGIGTETFLWKPEAPTGNSHYCFVALALTGAEKLVIPKIRSIRDLAAWSADDGKLTSRNVFFIEANGAETKVDTTYSQGDTEELMSFALRCTGCPLKQSWISFSSSTDIEGKKVEVAKTQITQEGQIIGVERKVPAGWKSSFAITYWTTAKPLKNWQIDFTASFKVQPGDPLFKFAKTAAELGLDNAAAPGAPVKTVIVGTATLRNASISFL
jgi:hypothetical protein